MLQTLLNEESARKLSISIEVAVPPLVTLAADKTTSWPTLLGWFGWAPKTTLIGSTKIANPSDLILKLVFAPPGPRMVTFVSLLNVRLQVPNTVPAPSTASVPASGEPIVLVNSAPNMFELALGSLALYREAP